MLDKVLVLANGDDPRQPALRRAGTLARGRFAELVLGNMAERVLHYGRGDVLVVAPLRVED